MCPYFSHAMAKSVLENSQSRTATKRIRSMPGNGPNGASVTYKDSESSYRERYKFEVSQRKLLFMRSLIRAQVTQLLMSPAPSSTATAAKQFTAYKVDTKKPVYEDQHIRMYETTNVYIRQIPLMVRIYSRQELNPNSLYLKILRHLGRKHPKLIYTFDIFIDAKNLYVFQEFLSQGNMVEYLEHTQSVAEAQVQFWAKQVFDSLDFLGDQAIAHRSITPNHLLVKVAGHELWVKLTGFQNSVIYWDMNNNDVLYCPCWPAQNQKTDGPNFQAPEVYGNPSTEEFDPILADTWSYGANCYFMLAKHYPFNINGTMEDLDSEILTNIRRLSSLSGDGQSFLHSTMRANANNRMPFDFIGRDPWLKIKTGLTKATVIQTPYKNLEKIKVTRKSGAKSGSGSHSSPGKSKGSVRSSSPKSKASTSSSSSSSASASIASSGSANFSVAGSSTSSSASTSGSSAGRSSTSSSPVSRNSPMAGSTAGRSSVVSGKSVSSTSSNKTKVKIKVKSKSKSQSKR